MVGAPAQGSPAGPPAAGPAVDDVETCARPALSPSLKLDPAQVAGGSGQAAGKKVVRQSTLALAVATRGRELDVPARAQALAVTAALAGDVSPGRSLEQFYRRLDAVPRWATLPPTIAVHRALGTPDPFAYEASWTRAVTLLSTLSAKRSSVASLVSTAGRAPSRCYVAASDAAALPLPPGSSYAIKAPRAARVAAATGPEVRKAAATELSAPCGTPVVAATSGTVSIVADEDAGPWLIKVRQPKTGVTTWYAHVQAPSVRTGDSVLVGQQLAEVGDLGQVTSCSLGLTVSKRSDGETRALDALPYLVGRGAAVSDQPTTVPATSFRMASYNVLGHHLTAPGGGKRGFGPGTTRVAGGIGKLEAQGVSIVVLNEFESPQAGVFLADGDWGVHRATFNNTFRDGNGNGNAVAWRADTWKLVDTDEFTVAWSTTLHMPVVTLQHLETGAQVTVIGVHNPASTSRQGNQSGARGSARAHRAGLHLGAARPAARRAGALRRRHERARRGLLRVHRHRSAAVLGRRQRRLTLPGAAARPGRLDLRHPRPRLRRPVHRPQHARPDQRPPAARGRRDLPRARAAARAGRARRARRLTARRTDGP